MNVGADEENESGGKVTRGRETFSKGQQMSLSLGVVVSMELAGGLSVGRI